MQRNTWSWVDLRHVTTDVFIKNTTLPDDIIITAVLETIHAWVQTPINAVGFIVLTTVRRSGARKRQEILGEAETSNNLVIMGIRELVMRHFCKIGPVGNVNIR